MRQMEDDGLTRKANFTISHLPLIEDNNQRAHNQLIDSAASSNPLGIPMSNGYNQAGLSMPTIEPNRIARDASDDRVVAAEDEEMDKVYVTNRTDKPFRIDELGGYDPEEDFENASHDLDDTGASSRDSRKLSRAPGNGGEDSTASASDNGENGDGGTTVTKFNDPEVEALFNDASETDETFASDEPEWAEDKTPTKRRQATANADPDQDENDDEPEENEAQQSEQTNQRQPDDRVGGSGRGGDDDDTNWVNDGVDDMEIPSQSDQERAIQKATRHEEALARQRKQEEDEAAAERAAMAQPSEEQVQQQDDPTDVRMPNADYMKEDLKDIEDETNLK